MRACILAVMTVCLPMGTAGFAQEAPVQADKPAEFVRPKLPEIPDEPKTVDPATLVPEMLAQKVTVEFKNASLREVAAWVRENVKATVIFDMYAFGDSSFLDVEPINEQLTEEPLYLLFDRLGALELDWYIEDNILHITTLEESETRMTTKSHNLSDLLDAGYTTEEISKTIQYMLPEGNWGDGVTIGDPEVGEQEWLADVLFVRQTTLIHRKVMGIFEALRRPSRMRYIYDPPNHDQLRSVLESNVSADFENVPLVEAIADLAQQTKSDIRLDKRGLRSSRIREREPITLKLEERRLNSILKVMLTQHELTWLIKDGVMWITTIESAEMEFNVAVFMIGDLCQNDGETKSLFKAIMQQTVGPWNQDLIPNDPEVGAILSPRQGIMIVRQTEPLLQEVKTLLADYRSALLQSKLRKRENPAEEMLTRYYRLHSAIANDLATALPLLVEPKSWSSEANPEAKGRILMSIASAPGLQIVSDPAQGKDGKAALSKDVSSPYSVLIVNQQRQIHEKIEKIISRIENGDPLLDVERKMQGGGGQFGGGGGGFGGGFFQLDPQLEIELPVPKQNP